MDQTIMQYNCFHCISLSINVKTKFIMFGTQKMIKYNDFSLLIDNLTIGRVNARTFIHTLGDNLEPYF